MTTTTANDPLLGQTDVSLVTTAIAVDALSPIGLTATPDASIMTDPITTATLTLADGTVLSGHGLLALPPVEATTTDVAITDIATTDTTLTLPDGTVLSGHGLLALPPVEATTTDVAITDIATTDTTLTLPDGTVLSGTELLALPPTDTVTPVDAPVLISPAPLTPPVITDIVDNTRDTPHVISDGGDTTDLRPTFNGTSVPGTTVEISDHGVKIGHAVTGTDWHWSFKPDTPLETGSVHSFHVTASADDGVTSTPATGVYQAAIGTDAVPLAPPVITDILSVVDGVEHAVDNGGQTTHAQPVLRGTSEPDTVVDVYDNGVKIGQAVTGENWSWEFSPAHPLSADGEHTFTVVASRLDGSSPTDSVWSSSCTINPVDAIVQTDTSINPDSVNANADAAAAPADYTPAVDAAANAGLDASASLDQLLANAGLTTADPVMATNADAPVVADAVDASSLVQTAAFHHVAHDLAY